MVGPEPCALATCLVCRRSPRRAMAAVALRPRPGNPFAGSFRRSPPVRFRSPGRWGAAAAHAPPRLVLLDRDGVLNGDVGPPGVLAEDQLRLCPGAGRAVARLTSAGAICVVVTNQSCVGKGLVTEDCLRGIHSALRRGLQAEDPGAVLADILVATETEAGTEADGWKKPGGGMPLRALRDAGVHPRDAVFVGDTLGDMRSASNAAISRRFLVAAGYHGQQFADALPPNAFLPLTVTSPGFAGIPEDVVAFAPVTLVPDLLTAADLMLLVDGQINS